jgi:hypothetical protein
MDVKWTRRGHGLNKPWYRRGGGARFKHDAALVAQHYPHLKIVVDEAASKVKLVGDIVLTAECGIKTRVPVRVEFPPDYPVREPEAFDAERRFLAAEGKELEDRHIEAGRAKFCLWLPPNSAWSPTDPDGLLKFLDYLSEHLERQLMYDVTKTWSGGEYRHNVHGYIQFVSEQLGVSENSSLIDAVLNGHELDPYAPCPCGALKKFKWCHRPEVLALRERARRR